MRSLPPCRPPTRICRVESWMEGLTIPTWHSFMQFLCLCGLGEPCQPQQMQVPSGCGWCWRVEKGGIAWCCWPQQVSLWLCGPVPGPTWRGILPSTRITTHNTPCNSLCSVSLPHPTAFQGPLCLCLCWAFHSWSHNNCLCLGVPTRGGLASLPVCPLRVGCVESLVS